MTTNLAPPREVNGVDPELVADAGDQGVPNVEPLMWVVIAVAVAAAAIDRGRFLIVSDLRFDENLTAWITSGTFTEAVGRSWNHQGQSPLYFAGLWIWQQFAGPSEVAMRVPSLLALAASVWQLVRFGRDLDRMIAGQVAAVLLVSLDVGATEARPYIFMILALIVSARAGVAWITSGRRRDGALWAVAGAAAMYFQPFAIYAVLPHIFIVWAAVRDGRARQLAVFVGMGALLLLPLVPQVLMLRARQDTLVIAPMPDVFDLLLATVPFVWSWPILAGIVAHIPGRGATEYRAVTPWKWFLLAWMLVPTVGLFLQSQLSGSSVFVHRYYLAAAPAAALVAGLILSRLSHRAVLVGSAAMIMATWMFLTPQWSRDWYSAVEVINSADPATEVWTVTGYIESNHPRYFVDGFDSAYLNAPLLWHGAELPLIGIPRLSTPDNVAIHDVNVARALDANVTILLVESAENEIRQPGPVYVEEALVRFGYRIVEQQPEFGVLMTTLAPPQR